MCLYNLFLSWNWFIISLGNMIFINTYKQGENLKKKEALIFTIDYFNLIYPQRKIAFYFSVCYLGTSFLMLIIMVFFGHKTSFSLVKKK